MEAAEIRSGPMPTAACLDAFGETVPIKVIALFMSVIEHYPAFQPTVAATNMRKEVLEAIIRQGRADAQLIHDFAITMRTDFLPREATRDVLGWLARFSHEPSASLPAERLIDWLLDSDKTHDAVIAALRMWVQIDAYPEVIDPTRIRLTEKELVELAPDDD